MDPTFGCQSVEGVVMFNPLKKTNLDYFKQFKYFKTDFQDIIIIVGPSSFIWLKNKTVYIRNIAGNPLDVTDELYF
jgi:hypothetical protein